MISVLFFILRILKTKTTIDFENRKIKLQTIRSKEFSFDEVLSISIAEQKSYLTYAKVYLISALCKKPNAYLKDVVGIAVCDLNDKQLLQDELSKYFKVSILQQL